MNRNTLEIFLPAFMVVFFGTIAVWANVRKRKKIRVNAVPKSPYIRRIRTIDLFYRVMLMISLSIALLYAYFPEYYYVTGPIDFLDNPVVNTIGVLVLKISLFWIVLAQFNIERTIARLNAGADEMSYTRLLSYSEKLILSGMLMMFFGLFITISSVLAILICIAATVLFEKAFNHFDLPGEF